MARYIDAEALIEDFDNDVHCLRMGGMKGTPRPLEISLKNVLERIEDAPTADVVPKSEVERLEKDNEKLTVNMNAFGLAAKRLKEEKDALAREIFEDIEKYYKEKIYLLMDMPTYLAELKKKYTESENKQQWE